MKGQLIEYSNYNVLWQRIATVFIYAMTISSLVEAQYQDSLYINRQVDSLIKVSAKLTDQKDYNGAFDVIKIAYQFLEKRGDSTSSLYGSVCNSHGRIYFFKGEYLKAEYLYLKSNEILKQKQNLNNSAYLTNIGCLGSLYLNIGKFEKAEQYLLESEQLGKIVIGEKHPDYALNLSNLGRVYRIIGLFDKSEYYLIKALKLREKYSGKESRSYAFSLNSLAILYKDRGNYLKAEKLYLEAIEIRKRVLGITHGDYIASLSNLAILYKNLGNYEKSESLFLEALSICTQDNREADYIEFTNIISNLGVLKYRLQNFEQAESLFLWTISILQNKMGGDHPTLVNCKANLANVYRATGEFTKAENLLLENVKMIEQSNGKHSYHYANALHNLGILYDQKGDQNIALVKCKEALEIRGQLFGREHPYCADSYEALADIYFRMGNFQTSGVYFDSLMKSNILQYKRSMLHLSEYELSQYINTFKQFQNKLYSLAYYGKKFNDKIVITCLDNILFYKNLLLRSNVFLQNKLNSDTANFEKLLLKKSLDYRLSLEYLKPLVKRDSLQFFDLRKQAIKLEKDLIGSIVGTDLKFNQISFKDIREKLKVNEVAIEFIHFNQVYGITKDSIVYAAILIKPGILNPQIIFLFEQKQLENLLEMKGESSTKQHLDILYSGVNNNEISQSKSETNNSLFKLIWQPLINELKEANKIYLSKTGLLHQLNLTAISDQNGLPLYSSFNIIELNSTRDLISSDTIVKDNQNAILFGGVNFDIDSLDVLKQENLAIIETLDAAKTTREINLIGQLDFELGLMDSNVRGGNWNYLHWTDYEINSISEIVNNAKILPTIFKGKLATEEKFKEIGQEKLSPKIIHLATHGFFFPNSKTQDQFSEDIKRDGFPFRISEHPMIRSGLILAGGNYAWRTGTPFKAEMEDGILTAYEISQMNLSNTELVVLSACETGLGDIKDNEGVYGLQRAFKIAGVKYLMMSLWQVPDRETKEFMVSFYKNWLTKKNSIPDAFRKTQREMRERFINPYAWAGFVLVE